MRTFVAASANLTLAHDGKPIPARGGAGHQAETDLSAASLLTTEDGKPQLTPLGSAVLAAWKKHGVVDDSDENELLRCLLLLREAKTLAVPYYLEMMAFWEEIRSLLPIESLIPNPDLLYTLSFLNTEIAGLNPWQLILQSKLPLAGSAKVWLQDIKQRLPAVKRAIDSLESRITGLATRSQGRKVFCFAMELLRLKPADAQGLLATAAEKPSEFIGNIPPKALGKLNEVLKEASAESVNLPALAAAFKKGLDMCPLQVDEKVVTRLVASLLAKRFVILTGLSGSGKTKLAQAFARWITPPSPECFAVVPVGADWASNEHIIGYPDNLNGGYFQQTALKLILHADKHKDLPHFLILDEMNLSHVERYFADLLSLIESEEKLHLHYDEDAAGNPQPRAGVPPFINMPPNLFIIGTVNVDETTYMFSPKVLDRANVLEFRVSEKDMEEFLAAPVRADLTKLADPALNGATFGPAFVKAASNDYPADLLKTEREQLRTELLTFFKALAAYNAEFGFRVGKEVARFFHFHKSLTGGKLDFRNAMDAQIVQKLLPKLHGSRNKLTPMLWMLASLCKESHPWTSEKDPKKRDQALTKFLVDVRTAVEAGDENYDPAKAADKLRQSGGSAHYPLSFDKIARMWAILEANGFVSFAEA
jgi:MoxR-like ATPase